MIESTPATARIAAYPATLFVTQHGTYSKAGASIEHWRTPSFLLRAHVQDMDRVVRSLTARRRARRLRHRARLHRRKLGGETANMGARRLRRAIAHAKRRAWHVDAITIGGVQVAP